MVLNRAGVTTVPMDTSQLTMAKVTGDPTVSWHGENAALTDSDATFGAISLQAKTVVTLVKLSLELSQDSANIEQILQGTITRRWRMRSTAPAWSASHQRGRPCWRRRHWPDRPQSVTVGAPTSWDWPSIRSMSCCSTTCRWMPSAP
jgi:hypothetical protein